MPKTGTIVHTWAELPLLVNPDHPRLYQKQLLTPPDADQMQSALHAVLFERLGKEGAVLPHYHDCCEVICITKAGDTLIVPAKEIHSVYNLKDEETEQISIFLPADAQTENRMFTTKILSGIPLPLREKGGEPA